MGNILENPNAFTYGGYQNIKDIRLQVVSRFADLLALNCAKKQSGI